MHNVYLSIHLSVVFIVSFSFSTVWYFCVSEQRLSLLSVWTFKVCQMQIQPLTSGSPLNIWLLSELSGTVLFSKKALKIHFNFRRNKIAKIFILVSFKHKHFTLLCSWCTCLAFSVLNCALGVLILLFS